MEELNLAISLGFKPQAGYRSSNWTNFSRSNRRNFSSGLLRLIRIARWRVQPSLSPKTSSCSNRIFFWIAHIVQI